MEARFELTWQSGARLVAVWQKPFPDESPDNFFYLEHMPGLQPRDVTSVRSSFPLLGVIPILTPLDVEEERLTDDYVINSISTRLSSRHFRNQLRLMKAAGTFDDFSRYIEPWLEDFGSHILITTQVTGTIPSSMSIIVSREAGLLGSWPGLATGFKSGCRFYITYIEPVSARR